jgi:hypothetical protein
MALGVMKKKGTPTMVSSSPAVPLIQTLIRNNLLTDSRWSSHKLPL